MALVPHKITALAESDAEGTDGKNIIAGAVVSLFDSSGAAVTLFDDENGNNGSTTKQTDASGQVIVWVTAGEYEESVNGSAQRAVTIGGRTVTSYANTASLENSRPTQTGQRAENRERANAQYVLAEAGYTAKPGDIVAANGRVWELQLDGVANVKHFGANGSTDDTQAFEDAVAAAISKKIALYIPSVDGGFITRSVDITGLKSLFGDGISSVVRHHPDILTGQHMFFGDSSSDITVENLFLDGSGVVSGEEARLLDFRRYSNVTVDNVWFYESSSSSLKVRGGETPNICENITVTNCRSIRSGRANTFNRNGLDFFKCRNVIVKGNTVTGSGFVPNNVGIILMGCQYVSCTNNVLEDNGSEQVQVIGTEFLTELPIESENRTRFVTVANNVFRHVNGYSNTTNLNLGENASFINVIGNDFSGAAGSEILTTPYVGDLIIQGNTIHDGQSGGITIGDKCYGNVLVSNNIIKNMQGSSGIVVFSDSFTADNVVIENNIISNLDTDGSSAVVRPFEIRGESVGGVHVRGNVCGGVYTHAVDTTSCTLVGDLLIHDNDFSGYTVTGWRAPVRLAYCWGNKEPDPESPSFYRGVFSFDLATGTSTGKTWNAEESKGTLEYRVVNSADSGGGFVFLAYGLFNGTDKKVRVGETGLAPAKGSVYSFAKP